MLFANPLLNVAKNILLVCVHYPHAGECTTALHVTDNFFNFFLQKRYFTAWFGTDLFIAVERSKDITHAKLLSGLRAKILDFCRM